jgi:hypothetical protein
MGLIGREDYGGHARSCYVAISARINLMEEGVPDAKAESCPPTH